ncbi:MAG: hypothetical protein JSR80_00615 [Verrucomicrobia bacterium]|nr:hypothetical protein [Verrucomicrobiota bacterium]
MTKIDTSCDRSLMFGIVFSAAATAVSIKIFNKYCKTSLGIFSSVPAYWGLRAYWISSKTVDAKKKQGDKQELIKEISTYLNNSNNLKSREIRGKIFSNLKALDVSAEVLECFRENYCLVNKVIDRSFSNLPLSKALWRWKTGAEEPDCALVYSVQHGPSINLFKEQPHNISFTVDELQNLSHETFANNNVGKVQFEGKTYWVSNKSAWDEDISEDEDDFTFEPWNDTLRKQAIEDWDTRPKRKASSQEYENDRGPQDLRIGI